MRYLVKSSYKFHGILVFFGVILFSAINPAGAIPLQIPLYDTTPEPGKPLSWSAVVYKIYDDQRNVDGKPANAQLSDRVIGPLSHEYTFTAGEAARFLVIFDLRVDGWRLVDRRSIWIDNRNCPQHPPFAFRCVLQPRKRGPYSTGETTVLVGKEGFLIVRLGTPNMGHIFSTSEKLKYLIDFQGQDLKARPVTVETQASLINWREKEEEIDRWPQTVMEEKTVQHELTAKDKSPGFYRLRLKIKGWGEAFLDGGILPPLSSRNDRIGINVSWSDQYAHTRAQIEEEAVILSRQGVRWLRTEYEWRLMEYVQGRYEWQHYDLIEKAARGQGLFMLPCFFRVPPWASAAPKAQDYFHHIMKREYFPDYYRFVMAAVKRYHDWIKTVSVWNEIDSCWFLGGTAADYFEILKNCHEQIKGFDPKIQVTCSGISATGESTAGEFFRDVLKMGGAKYFEILDTHYDSRESLEAKKKDLEKYGGPTSPKPIWVTEQSGHQVADRSLQAAARQAAERVKGLVMALAGNPEKVFLWGDIDQHPHLLFWGNLKAEDRTVRSAFFAFSNLINLLADRQCTTVYSERPQLSAYRFTSPSAARKEILVLWSESDTTVVLEGLNDQMERVDLMGVGSPLKSDNGRLFLPVTSEPVFLCMNKIPSKLKEMAAFSVQEYSGIPGTDTVLQLRIYNPLAISQTIKISLGLPEGWTTGGKNRNIEIPSDTEKEISLAVHLPRDAPSGQWFAVKAKVTGLGGSMVTASAGLRVKTREGVMLVEAENAPRSQGPCPGTSMHIGQDSGCSGGKKVLMFWGRSWMEYDIPFSKPGRYKIGVRAQGQATGHPDEKPFPLLLTVSLDGKKIGSLTWPADLKMVTRFLDGDISKAGLHRVRVEFPVDAGDIFVDYLTVEKEKN